MTITEVAQITGLSTHTIRYYEKLGILPKSKRVSGKNRVYSDRDIKFISFITSLKNTGMSLEDINEMVKDGCILDVTVPEKDQIIEMRKIILEKHLQKLKNQMVDLEQVIMLTERKIEDYNDLLDKKGRRDLK